MKQLFLLGFLLAAVVVRGLAQDLVFSYAERREKPYFPYGDRNKGVSVVAFMLLSVDLWVNNKSRQPELDSVQRLCGRPNIRAYMNFDPADSIVFAVERLTRDTAAGYEYRDGPEMAYIGKYKGTLDHYLTVEVRQKGMDTAVSSIMIWWPKIYPKVLGVFRLRDLKDLMEVMRDKGARDNFRGLRPGWTKIEGLLKFWIRLLRLITTWSFTWERSFRNLPMSSIPLAGPEKS